MSILKSPVPVGGKRKVASLLAKVRTAAPARKPVAMEFEARRGWATERQFVQALKLERKRAEHSGQPFLLMLLASPGVFGGNGGSRLFPVAAAVGKVIREGDLCGWYRQNHTLGVIFTEVNPAEVESTVEALEAKVEGAVRGYLKPADVERTEISFHLFPKAPDGDGSQASENSAPYPDVRKRVQSSTSSSRAAIRFSLPRVSADHSITANPMQILIST